jgi:HK97 family phage portal protein
MATNFLTRLTRAFNRRDNSNTSTTALERRSNPLENPAVPLTAGWQYVMGSGHHSEAGEVINDQTALQNSVAWACCRLIAESISSLPLRLLEVTDAGKQAAVDEPLFGILQVSPNDEMSSVQLLEQIALCLTTRGNSYTQILRNSKGEVTELWPLNPHQVTPLRNQQGNLVYRVNVAPDGATAEYRVLDKMEVLHCRLLGYTGLTGMSPVDAQRQALGLGIGQVKNAARFFRNFSTPSLVLINKDPLPMSPVDKTRAREDWETLTSGANGHRVGIIDNNFEIQQLSLTAEQSQFIQSRQMSTEDICSIWKVPSNLISQTHAATHSNLEQQLTNLLTLCLTPYLVRIEREIQIKLLPKNSRMRRYTVEFDTSMYLRGDLASQTAFYLAGVNGGWFSPADVRHKLGENIVPVEAGLNVYRTPVNYMSSALLVNQQAPEMNPQPEPIEDEPGNVRAALSNYGAAYSGIMRDAIRRTINGEPAVRAFGPILESIQDSVSTTVDVQPDATKLVDYLTKLEARAAKWNEADVESIAADEVRKAVRCFVFAAHDAAARKVIDERP